MLLIVYKGTHILSIPKWFHYDGQCDLYVVFDVMAVTNANIVSLISCMAVFNTDMLYV